MRRLLLAAGLIGLGVALSILPALSQSPSSGTGTVPGTITTVASGIGTQSDSAFAITIDKAGNIYAAVGDAARSGAATLDPTSNRVLIVQPNGSVQPYAGTGAAGSIGDGGPAISAQFSFANLAATSLRAMAATVTVNDSAELGTSPVAPNPSGIALNAAGDICVADTQNATIRCMSGVQPSATIRNVAGRWATPSSTQFVTPAGLAADANGNLYVTDPGANAVLKVSDDTVSTIAHVIAPGAIAVDAAGTNVFVASTASGSVFEIDATTQQGSAPTSAQSATGGSAGAPIRTVAQIASPSGLAVDSGGNLFISDAQANVIRRLNVNSSASNSGQPVIVAGTGTAGDSGDGGPAQLAQLNTPGSLALDQKGNLFVADEGNHAIRELALVAQAGTSGTTLSPSSATYGDQVTGGTTAAQTFTLTNSSTGAITISGISFTGANPGDFAQTSTCGTSLAASATCSIMVTFSPQASGTRSGTLQIVDSDPSSPQTAALSGTGDDFEITSPNGNLNPTQSVLQGQVVPFNLQVVSDGTFSGPVALQCPTNLPALATCTLSAASVNVVPGTPSPFTITFGAVLNINNGAALNRSPRTPVSPTGPAGPERPMLFLIAIMLGILAIALMADSRFFAARSAAASIDPMHRTRPFTHRLRWALAGCCAIAAFGLLLPACNSNPNALNTTSNNPNTKTSSTPPAPSPTDTPIGSYTMQVIGSAQNAARGITITLDVIKN